MKWEEKIRKFGDPIAGKIYVCKVQSFNTQKIREMDLKCVKEDDCLWRTTDDNSEIDEWNWDVIEWREKA